jgi:hypothetical protein
MAQGYKIDTMGCVSLLMVPARVVVLKTSRFRPEEAEGIDSALQSFLQVSRVWS